MTFDAEGHCTDCHLSDYAILHLDKEISLGKALSLVRRLCGHTVMYRSLGLWTSTINLVAPVRALALQPLTFEQLLRASARP